MLLARRNTRVDSVKVAAFVAMLASDVIDTSSTCRIKRLLVHDWDAWEIFAAKLRLVSPLFWRPLGLGNFEIRTRDATSARVHQFTSDKFSRKLPSGWRSFRACSVCQSGSEHDGSMMRLLMGYHERSEWSKSDLRNHKPHFAYGRQHPTQGAATSLL